MQKEYEVENGTLTTEHKDQLDILMMTPKGTVVLDRDFGIDMSFVDMPIPIAQTMLAAELAVQIEKYIPSLELKEVKLTGANVDGSLRSKVVVNYVE